MEFGSKFVFNYSDSEEEVVSDDELEEGLNEETHGKGSILPLKGLSTGSAAHKKSTHKKPKKVKIQTKDRTLSSSSSNEEDVLDEEVLAPSAKQPTRMVAGPPAPLISLMPSPMGGPPGAMGMMGGPPGAMGMMGGPPGAPHVSLLGGPTIAPPPPRGGTPMSSGGGRYVRLEESGSAADALKKRTKSYHHPPRKVHHWQTPTPNSFSDQVKGKKYRRADTNVLSVKFGHLTSPSNMHTGDPVYCSSCTAVLSSLSKLAPDGEEMLWHCEYCGEKNQVDLLEEEIPKKQDIAFMLKPAPTTAAGGRSGVDQSLVVFCVDVSGSMCVTTEVPGKIKLRGDRLDRLQTLNTERENQFMPGQRKNVTFVSRLQGMQAAVDFQLAEMAKDHPDRRVALVTFNNEVTAIGDGTIPPVHLSGDKLKNREEMQKAGQDLTLPQTIHTTRRVLGDKVFDLEEGGQTALGPALLLSVSMASRVPGSKVIICTDGMANIGLGALDNINNEGDFENASSFYEEVSQQASETGVTVSVTTIKGTDCKLTELGQLAAKTQGQVNIVDPMKLTEEFGNILADSMIATNVQATLVLHKGLYFRDEEVDTSKVTRQIGNVTKDTEITFEYGVRHVAKKQKGQEKKPQTSIPKPLIPPAPQPEPMETDEPQPEAVDISREEPGPSEQIEPEPQPQPEAGASGQNDPTSSIDKLTELPFQLQIVYMDMEGSQAMRVLTQTRPLTKDRMQAEQGMNAQVLGIHGAQRSANMALEGAYTHSRLNAFMYQRLMYRNVPVSEEVEDVYDCYMGNMRPMENVLNQQQQRERQRSSFGRTHSDESEDDEVDEDKTEESKAAKKTGKYKPLAGKKSRSKAQRRMECDDTTAHAFYSNYKSSSTTPQWKKK